MALSDMCKDVLFTKEIGPFSAKTDLGTISVSIASESRATFTGEIRSCNGQDLVNGFADISIMSVFERVPIENGQQLHSIIRCGNTPKASIRITDMGNNVLGPLQELDISSGEASLGIINVCDGSLSDFFEYTLDTIYRQFLPPAQDVNLTKGDTSYSILCYSADTTGFTFQFGLKGPGNSLSSCEMTIAVNQEFYKQKEQLTLQITELGEAGEYITGTFSGTMKGYYNEALPERNIYGRFRLKRNN